MRIGLRHLLLFNKYTASQRLLNPDLKTDAGGDGTADNWTWSKNAAHTTTLSIDDGQKVDLTVSTSVTSSYLYQYTTVTEVGRLARFSVDLLTNATAGTISQHVQMRFRQSTTNISTLSTGVDPYPTQTTIELSGIVPATTDNILIILFCYSTTVGAAGQFYMRKSQLIV